MEIFTLLLNVILIGVNFVLIAYVGIQYLRTKFKTLILLNSAFISFLISNTLNFFIIHDNLDVQGAPQSASDVYHFLVTFTFSNIFTIIALFFLMLFFEAFKQDSVLTTKNTILAILTAMLSSSTFIVLAILSAVVNETPELLLTISRGGDIEQLNVPESSLATMGLAGMLMAISAIFLLYMLISFVRLMRKSLNAITNPNLQIVTKRMRQSTYIMVFGSFITGILFGGGQGPSNGISTVVFIIGLIGLVYYYNKAGLFVLQADDLRRLLIINKAGIPIYSYNFRNFDDLSNQTIQEQDTQEVLFSGALKSISTLLSEFTGGNQVVHEIKLEKLVLMVKSFDDGNFIVLAVDRSTRFVGEAMDKFSQTVNPMVSEVPFGETLSSSQVKFANEAIEHNFGRNYIVQIGEYERELSSEVKITN